MTVTPRYPHLAFVLTLCVVVALVWAWQPNPLVVVALCFGAVVCGVLFFSYP